MSRPHANESQKPTKGRIFVISQKLSWRLKDNFHLDLHELMTAGTNLNNEIVPVSEQTILSVTM